MRDRTPSRRRRAGDELLEQSSRSPRSRADRQTGGHRTAYCGFVRDYALDRPPPGSSSGPRRQSALYRWSAAEDTCTRRPSSEALPFSSAPPRSVWHNRNPCEHFNSTDRPQPRARARRHMRTSGPAPSEGGSVPIRRPGTRESPREPQPSTGPVRARRSADARSCAWRAEDCPCHAVGGERCKKRRRSEGRDRVVPWTGARRIQGRRADHPARAPRRQARGSDGGATFSGGFLKILEPPGGHVRSRPIPSRRKEQGRRGSTWRPGRVAEDDPAPVALRSGASATPVASPVKRTDSSRHKAVLSVRPSNPPSMYRRPHFMAGPTPSRSVRLGRATTGNQPSS